jgi:hypothetical protein
MESKSTAYHTTYKYTPLQSDRHIRLLQILTNGDEPNGDEQMPTCAMIQRELPREDKELDFEAVSYTWGKPERVAGLTISGGPGIIGLTANLTEAMPYLAKHSKSGLLWIDQLCIDQGNMEEKSKQIGIMHEIYKAADKVIIWLGPEDDDCYACKKWLIDINDLLPRLPSADETSYDSYEVHRFMRFTEIIRIFTCAKTNSLWIPVIRRFWKRQWFTRGWVVQEFLLARDEVFLTGNTSFNMRELTDLINARHSIDTEETSFGYYSIMILKLWLHTDPQPLRFMRIMNLCGQQFQTSEPGDQLYAFLGMLDGLDSAFRPDYSISLRLNFTRFAAVLAQHFGSLDFLSFCSVNTDVHLETTPIDLTGLPSWVPSWSGRTSSTPFRLAVGGSRFEQSKILWNAAKGRRHGHGDQNCDAEVTGRLLVRGRIIDSVDAISTANFYEFTDVDHEYHKYLEYLRSLVDQIKQDLHALEHWTEVEMIDFLYLAVCSGKPPAPTVEQALEDGGEDVFHGIVRVMCVRMGIGRSVMRTRHGRTGLAPAVGTRLQRGEVKESVIAILHGCIVPVMLNVLNEERNEYQLVGDCYVEGIMHGEAVTWEEGEADILVLV